MGHSSPADIHRSAHPWRADPQSPRETQARATARGPAAAPWRSPPPQSRTSGAIERTTEDSLLLSYANRAPRIMSAVAPDEGWPSALLCANHAPKGSKSSDGHRYARHTGESPGLGLAREAYVRIRPGHDA